MLLRNPAALMKNNGALDTQTAILEEIYHDEIEVCILEMEVT